MSTQFECHEFVASSVYYTSSLPIIANHYQTAFHASFNSEKLASGDATRAVLKVSRGTSVVSLITLSAWGTANQTRFYSLSTECTSSSSSSHTHICMRVPHSTSSTKNQLQDLLPTGWTLPQTTPQAPAPTPMSQAALIPRQNASSES